MSRASVLGTLVTLTFFWPSCCLALVVGYLIPRGLWWVPALVWLVAAGATYVLLKQLFPCDDWMGTE